MDDLLPIDWSAPSIDDLRAEPEPAAMVTPTPRWGTARFGSAHDAAAAAPPPPIAPGQGAIPAYSLSGGADGVTTRDVKSFAIGGLFGFILSLAFRPFRR